MRTLLHLGLGHLPLFMGRSLSCFGVFASTRYDWERLFSNKVNFTDAGRKGAEKASNKGAGG